MFWDVGNFFSEIFIILRVNIVLDKDEHSLSNIKEEYLMIYTVFWWDIKVYGARVTFFSEYTVYAVSNLSSSDLRLEYCNAIGGKKR